MVSSAARRDAKQGERVGDAFDADRADLDRSTVSHGLDERNQAAADEIDISDRPVFAVDQLASRQLDLLQGRP